MNRKAQDSSPKRVNISQHMERDERKMDVEPEAPTDMVIKVSIDDLHFE